MLWPQLVHGVAMMICLLPPTRLALGHLPNEKIPDASGLFNLMRNLGGAIGIALVAPMHATAILARLRAGDVDAAKAVGLPIKAFLASHGGPVSKATEAVVRPLVEKLALARAINEAWMMIVVLVMAAVLGLVFIVRFRRDPQTQAK